jgi:hypothetical protein
MTHFWTDVLIKRETSGHYEVGSWVWDAPTDTPFTGDAQPASGKVLSLLPEGTRASDVIIVYAPVDMNFTPADALTSKSGDIIVFNGEEYRVRIAKKWNHSYGLRHWELTAIRIKEGE